MGALALRCAQVAAASHAGVGAVGVATYPSAQKDVEGVGSAFFPIGAPSADAAAALISTRILGVTPCGARGVIRKIPVLPVFPGPPF